MTSGEYTVTVAIGSECHTWTGYAKSPGDALYLTINALPEELVDDE